MYNKLIHVNHLVIYIQARDLLSQRSFSFQPSSFASFSAIGISVHFIQVAGKNNRHVLFNNIVIAKLNLFKPVIKKEEREEGKNNNAFI